MMKTSCLLVFRHTDFKSYAKLISRLENKEEIIHPY